MTGREEQPHESREDAAWRSIVENFGDRASLPEPQAESQAESRAESQAEPQAPRFEAPDPGPATEIAGGTTAIPWDDEGHYTPPEPPPLPRPRGARLAAWFGLFGVPALALLCVVVGVSLPPYVGLVLIVWFVAGFGYLVATMSNSDPDSGWDDGAVL